MQFGEPLSSETASPALRISALVWSVLSVSPTATPYINTLLMLFCIGSYLLCKMMGLQVISMGGSLTEIEVAEEVLLLGEVPLLGTGEVLNPHGAGMWKTPVMTLVINPVGEVVEILKLATAGLEQQVKAVAMIG